MLLMIEFGKCPSMLEGQSREPHRLIGSNETQRISTSRRHQLPAILLAMAERFPWMGEMHTAFRGEAEKGMTK